MIRITDAIAIDEGELEERFIRASGPGGQNVNKLASAVQLRFDVRRSPSLPAAVRARTEKLAGNRLTAPRSGENCRTRSSTCSQPSTCSAIQSGLCSSSVTMTYIMLRARAASVPGKGWIC